MAGRDWVSLVVPTEGLLQDRGGKGRLTVCSVSRGEPPEYPQRGGGGRWAWAHRHSLMTDGSSRGEGLTRCARCSPSLWATCRVKWTLVRTVLVRTKINSPAQRFAFPVQLPLTAASSQLPKAPGSINRQGKNMTHEHVSFSSLSWPDRFEQGPRTL